MPSENKTANIGLNQWQANEYPKREDFNADNLAIDEALSGKLSKTGEGKDVTVTFDEATTRVNIGTGEKISVVFGKIKKWFSDLTDLAFGKCGSAANQALYTTTGGVVTADKLPVAAGGTGASTAEGARTNLAISDATIPISDDVATALGLDPASDPQVKDGFDNLSSAVNPKQYIWEKTQFIDILRSPQDLQIVNKPNENYGEDVEYGSNLDFSGEVPQIINPTIVNVTYNNASQYTNILKNMYVKFGKTSLNGMLYKGTSNTVLRTPTPYGDYLVYADNVQLVDISEKYLGQISSYNSSAYPQNLIEGRLKTTYIGRPQYIGTQIETGSYWGTGISGPSNPTVLTFRINPKLVIILGYEDVLTQTRHSKGFGVFLKDVPVGRSYAADVPTESLESEYVNALAVTWGTNTMSFFSRNSPKWQLNLSDEIKEYHYVAIG